MLSECPFCRPEIVALSLWESTHYRIMADQYPRCVGHILLLSKAHYLSHMHAPAEHLHELEIAQGQARRFLLDNFGKASFLENGGIHQEVPHAHLHGVPFALSVPSHWIERGLLTRVEKWEDVWQERERTGHYCYVETSAGRFILRQHEEYSTLLHEIRSQLVLQTAAEIDPVLGVLKRSGQETMKETIRIWKAWAGDERTNSATS